MTRTEVEPGSPVYTVRGLYPSVCIPENAPMPLAPALRGRYPARQPVQTKPAPTPPTPAEVAS